jgi:hypothetical protein
MEDGGNIDLAIGSYSFPEDKKSSTDDSIHIFIYRITYYNHNDYQIIVEEWLLDADEYLNPTWVRLIRNFLEGGGRELDSQKVEILMTWKGEREKARGMSYQASTKLKDGGKAVKLKIEGNMGRWTKPWAMRESSSVPCFQEFTRHLFLKR